MRIYSKVFKTMVRGNLPETGSSMDVPVLDVDTLREVLR